MIRRSPVITHAAEWAKSHPGDVVHVNGFASTSAAARPTFYWPICARQVVVDQLQSDGVDAKHVKQRGHGPVQLRLTAQESRRVEISFDRH